MNAGPGGRSLCFNSNGTQGAIRTASGLQIVDIAERRALAYHALDQIVDIATVGTELWVAAGSPPRLHTFHADHHEAPVRDLWGDRGVLRACVTGADGALWSASPPGVLLAAGTTTTVALDAEPDCVIPVSPTRWVVCRRERISLRDPGTERWSVTVALGGGTVVDGVTLFGGRSVALLVARDGSLSYLLVVALHDGSLHQRIGLAGIHGVHFATGRGLALMRCDADKLVVVDLRFGHVMKEHREPQPILDAAIDPAGQVLMVRFGDAANDTAISSMRELLAGAAPTSVVGSVEPAAPEPPTAATEAPAHARPFFETDQPLPLPRLLAPRPRVPDADPVAASLLLETYREVIAAMCGAAIARAWDEGRLCAPVEGGLPFYTEVSGLRRRTRGRAPEDVSEATGEVDESLATVRAVEASFGTAVPPLAALAQEFGLSAAAQMVLLVVAAPALWGELARLYGILANDMARPVVDELLISQVLDPHVQAIEIARELDRNAPLVKYGLVRLASSGERPFVALSCDPIVFRLLQASDRDAELANIRIIRDFRAFDRLLIPAATKADLARRLEQAPAASAGRIVVRGRSGSGRHALLAALGGAANRALAIIDTTMILRDLRRRSDELVAMLRRVNLAGMLPCLDGLESIPTDDANARDLVRQILDEHPGPLALRLPLDTEPPLAPGYLAIDLPPLSMEQRTSGWRVFLDEHKLFVRDPDELADRYRVGPGVIATVCAKVAAQLPAVTDAIDELKDVSLALEIEVRQFLETKLRATASRVERLATWSRVILPPDIQESVLELISRIKHRRTVFDTWGMTEVLASARGVSALFQGGPGTGKTLVASAIANELGMDLYRVDLSRVMSKWIGETEQNLAKLFDAAEDGNTIILFDEADSLFAKRTEVKSSVDRYANLEVNYLLQRLDTFEGIAILTTNFGTSIDNAFKRRLSFRLTFPFPDEDAREALWRAHLPKQIPTAGEFDLPALARRYQLSGGYIRNAALRAAFLAAEEQTPLRQEHLERAVKAEFREIGKIAESGVLE